MKEILFFTNGNANNANIWSNVPYCFSHAIENNGITVHQIDYSTNPTFVRFYDLVLRRVLDGITFRKIRFPYLRATRLFKLFAERKVKRPFSYIRKRIFAYLWDMGSITNGTTYHLYYSATGLQRWISRKNGNQIS